MITGEPSYERCINTCTMLTNRNSRLSFKHISDDPESEIQAEYLCYHHRFLFSLTCGALPSIPQMISSSMNECLPNV